MRIGNNFLINTTVSYVVQMFKGISKLRGEGVAWPFQVYTQCQIFDI